jgi:signal transduction histidine kinase
MPRAPEVPLASPAGLPHLDADAYALQAQLDELAERFDQMREQLRQTQKLASIGTTAAMVAHEFNNLLTPVVAYARQALDTDDVALMRTALNKTLQRAQGLREMADRIVGLAKQSDTVVKAVNVKDLVENALGCLGRELGKDNIAVNLQIDPGLSVRANENQLLQVLFNLVINARQAMLGRRGRLTIDAAPTRDAQVLISVRDTGCGISTANLPHIFEPFFTTKKSADRPDRRGLGLGLSICRDIMDELGGTISVESTENVGTTFTLKLPLSE